MLVLVEHLVPLFLCKPWGGSFDFDFKIRWVLKEIEEFNEKIKI